MLSQSFPQALNDLLPSITLIGDSAHVMTPFAGVGVNLAIEDALILARSLIKRRGNSSMLTDGLQEFEKNMFKRAEAGAATTYQNLVGTYGRPDSNIS
jgi:2-polyprenyl-6-methoxyphenol hydroxylase-like FAD-dependent oxidoreductase